MAPSSSSADTVATPAADAEYEVYAYDLPALTEDGTSALPTPPGVFERFTTLEAAERHSRALAPKRQRVQILRVVTTAGKSEARLVSRIADGKEERAEDIVRR